ncbi:T9SS type A sorting domain-containing protein [Paracnuella aquatica]|uniref:T9SS type A sorting domain-containing protein n=1 Tax=Paracnuella aquatica TaxID=2268757 RepID=UPI000DEF317E|nr:T9SS type A sorting domain-containing protein [Paracnuella aquatica]RPD44197.1 T9SS C-terminal target domain-containing protein [Paracnuella aquatica]
MRIGLRLLFCLLSTLLCFALYATEFVFIGSGSYANPANWKDGVVPPGFTSADDIIRIKGHAIASDDCDIRQQSGDFEEDLWSNMGMIIIEPEAILDLRNCTQFDNGGNIVVEGTLINTTHIAIFESGNVTIWGTFINRNFISNQGNFTIEDGGRVENESSAPAGFGELDMLGTLILKKGGSIVFGKSENMQLGANFINQATLTGNVEIPGNLDNSGVLAPGNSPGRYSVRGDYMAASTAVHEFEVGGTSKDLYDVLDVTENANIAGTLRVSLIDGFVINDDHEIPIITGAINGVFSSVDIPRGYKLVYRKDAIVLQKFSVTPVTFIGLTVKRHVGGIKLSWEVAGEVGVKEYIVEASSNGTMFYSVGSVQAKGLHRYDYQESNSTPSTYYRIKSIDIDGTAKYSQVVRAPLPEQNSAVNIFPSPAQTYIIIRHEQVSNDALVRVTTTDGILVKTVRPNPSTTSIRLDIANLPAGLYLIQLINEFRTYTAKFIKQ